MALKKSFKKLDNFGIEVDLPDCYIKVVAVSATKDEAQMSINVMQSQDGSSYFSETHKFSLDLYGPNPIKQGYLHLKTLQAFADAVDC
jgi:hypothetical protein